MHYLGILIGIHLILGLMTAIRLEFFDGGEFKKRKEILIDEYRKREDKDVEILAEMLNNRRLVFIILVLMGVFAFYGDFKYTFSRKNK